MVSVGHNELTHYGSFQYKNCISWYMEEHFTDKMAVRQSCLHHTRNISAGKAESVQWNSTTDLNNQNTNIREQYSLVLVVHAIKTNRIADAAFSSLLILASGDIWRLIWVNIVSGNGFGIQDSGDGLLSDDSKPLLEPLWTYGTPAILFDLTHLALVMHHKSFHLSYSPWTSIH